MDRVSEGTRGTKDGAASSALDASEGDEAERENEGQTSSAASGVKSSAFFAEALPILGRKAHAHAAGLARAERARILKQSARPWDGYTEGTAWSGGKYDTTAGTQCRSTWEDFAGMMTDYAQKVVDKGEGLWFTPGLSSNGRCRDADIEAIAQLAHDCDGAGDWLVMREVLEATGLAYVMQRSSRHKPEQPKWHLHIPLVEAWQGTKAEWRAIYRHCVAWLSAAAELLHDVDARPVLYGFDIATDRMGQPWFPAARRSEADSPPETICSNGKALDLNAFLKATGFDQALAEQEALAAMPARKRRTKTGATLPPVDDLGPASGLLSRAFRHAGWLGPEVEGGKVKVQCPWENQHTTGSRFDSSTILFPPSPGEAVGWFFCQHAHCRDCDQRDVLVAIPAEALEAARAELRTERISRHTIRTPEARVSSGGNDDAVNGSRETPVAQKFPTTDMGNAERLIALHGEDIRYCFPKRTWMSWDGARWAPDNAGTLVELAKKAVRSIYVEAAGCDNYEERHALGQHAARSEKYERVMAIAKLAQSPSLPTSLRHRPRRSLLSRATGS
jgi:hypothetical protein